MKKIILTITLLFALTQNVLGLEINSTNAVMYNMNENEVIFEKNKDEKISIASLTKIMTTIVAIENIDDLDKTITIKVKDFDTLYEENASLAGFVVGEEVTYRDLLYGTFLPSGAEATQALANNLTGSISNFVELMNQKAKELNLKNTHFANTTGLDNKDNYSTVEDVATLLKYCLKNETFKTIFETKSYTTSDKKLIFYSTLNNSAQKYGYNVDYIRGGKTGYTDDAGRCLASTAIDKANEINYLLVTCGASVDSLDAYHIKDAYNIYNYFFDNYKYQTILDSGELLVSIKAQYGKKEYANFYTNEKVTYYLNNDFDKNKISIKYDGLKLIKNTTKKKDKIGKIDIYYDDEIIKSLNIYLNDEYQFSIINFLVQTKIIYVIIVIILLLIIFRIRHKKRKKRKIKRY